METQNEMFAVNPASADVLNLNRSRIAELHLPASNPLSSQPLLTGILRELNDTDDNRWVCWIADTPVKSFLSADARRRGHHLLQVLARDASGTLPLALRALQGGRSHTVVMLAHTPLSRADYAQLEWAARKGQAECLLIYLDSAQ
ncbi:hypothetical protein [Litorivivens sp.]|uniref:hypothetical protein n=1 Tax=Litorivivens sp. TaxID=2020868 RepID=UPI003567FE9C